MKTIIISALCLLCMPIHDANAAARTLKTHHGNCTGQNTTYSVKYWVDLNDDNKADYTVTVWCNFEVSVDKLTIVSGDWREDWSSWNVQVNYAGITPTGKAYYNLTYKDNVTNSSIGSEVKDSNDAVATVAWWAAIVHRGPVDFQSEIDGETQPLIDLIRSEDGVSIFSFHAFQSGVHKIEIETMDSTGHETVRVFIVVADDTSTVRMQINEMVIGRIAGISIWRPSKRVDWAGFDD